jgi:hypothetical protein
MSSETEIIHEFMEGQRQAVIDLQQRKGIKASGKSADGLRVITKQEGTMITSELVDTEGYFQYQEEGRGPGRYSPVQKIYEWLSYQKYGLTYANDRERRSLAFAIAKTHGEKGSKTFREGGRSGVISESGFEDGIKSLGQKLSRFHEAKITSILNEAAAL